MNIQQLQYVQAVAAHQHFETAAAHCHVTQSTLSTMIARLEAEWGITLFNRKRKPVVLTAEGAVIIERIKSLLAEYQQLNEQIQELKGELKGQIQLAVIPTLAPYLLPLFIKEFYNSMPQVHLHVQELTTQQMVNQLLNRTVGIGLASLPLSHADLIEIPLFDEPFMLYDSSTTFTSPIPSAMLKEKSLLLMEEGHCMRTQVTQLCAINDQKLNNFSFNAGSIESLIGFVKVTQSATLLPGLAVKGLGALDKKHVVPIIDPTPVRNIGLVVHKHFAKKRLIKHLTKTIQTAVKPYLPQTNTATLQLAPL